MKRGMLSIINVPKSLKFTSDYEVQSPAFLDISFLHE